MCVYMCVCGETKYATLKGKGVCVCVWSMCLSPTGSGRLPEAIRDGRRSDSCTARIGAKSAAVAMATPQDGDGPPEQFR